MTERKNAIRLPKVACEVTAQGVAATRTEGGNGVIAASYSRALAVGVLAPSLNAPNVQDARALREAIEQALSAVGGRGQDVIAVLPDSATRVMLLDFDSFPDRRQEAEATVRFRLRKSLPFDVDKTVVSFDAQITDKGPHVVATIVVRSVLDEYEEAFRSAGCAPGVVLPSSLAALGALDGERPAMLLKVAPDSTSVAVVKDGQLILFRSLEGCGNAPPQAERIADDIYPSLVFFQDNYGMSVDELYVGGVVDVEQIAAVLKEQTGLRVKELIPASILSGNLRHDFPGAVAALL